MQIVRKCSSALLREELVLHILYNVDAQGAVKFFLFSSGHKIPKW